MMMKSRPKQEYETAQPNCPSGAAMGVRRFDPSIRQAEHDAINIGTLCESRRPRPIRLLAYAPFLESGGSMQMTRSGSRDAKRPVKGKL
jgi:hypothetical protein